MPTTIEELEAAIQDTESEANSMLFLNQNVLQEYQNRQHEVSKCLVQKCWPVAMIILVLVLSMAKLSIENLGYVFFEIIDMYLNFFS